MLRFNACINLFFHIGKKYFNTSYVTVQRSSLLYLLKNVVLFQYILCYGSTWRAVLYCFVKCDISIHPMLRFNMSQLLKTTVEVNISIHPMLRFNEIEPAVMAGPDFISIHPMLRFNTMMCVRFGNLYYFNTSYVTVQRPERCLSKKPKPDFNTSYVTVQRIRFNTFQRARSISIHPMLRFNL